jgi:hypothetical protein
VRKGDVYFWACRVARYPIAPPNTRHEDNRACIGFTSVHDGDVRRCGRDEAATDIYPSKKWLAPFQGRAFSKSGWHLFLPALRKSGWHLFLAPFLAPAPFLARPSKKWLAPFLAPFLVAEAQGTYALRKKWLAPFLVGTFSWLAKKTADLAMRHTQTRTRRHVTRY